MDYYTSNSLSYCYLDCFCSLEKEDVINCFLLTKAERCILLILQAKETVEIWIDAQEHQGIGYSYFENE